MNKLKNSWGEIIRIWRKEKKMSQEELAEKAGLTSSCISKIECGTVVPKLDTVEQIANALGIALHQLLDIRKLEMEKII